MESMNRYIHVARVCVHGLFCIEKLLCGCLAWYRKTQVTSLCIIGYIGVWNDAIKIYLYLKSKRKSRHTSYSFPTILFHHHFLSVFLSYCHWLPQSHWLSVCFVTSSCLSDSVFPSHNLRSCPYISRPFRHTCIYFSPPSLPLLFIPPTQEPAVLTTSQGIPIDDKTNSVTAGPRGPMLLQDTVYQDEIAHFDRERIPERVVHAKGAG